MDTIVVLTGKNLGRMIEEGGSGYWKADSRRVRQCNYLIATANSKPDYSDFSNLDQGKAFLIGKVVGTKPWSERPDRLVIEISEYAEISILDAWPGHRNPVLYTDIASFDIDLNALDWKSFPEPEPQANDIAPLSVEEAKRGLAKKFEVDPSQIEIVIRG